MITCSKSLPEQALSTRWPWAIPALRNPLQELRPEYGGVYENDLLNAVREAIAKIGGSDASVPARSRGTLRMPEEGNTPSPEPTKPTPPRADNVAAFNAPPGLRDGVNRLLQRLKENNELVGDVTNYKVIIPPDYNGNETEYEIGFLNPSPRFYVYRTFDGGQTWAPHLPTNPYLIRIRNNALQARKRARSGTSGSRSTRSPMMEPPREPRGSGEPTPSGTTHSADEDSPPNGPLAGTWRASGERFDVHDDGKEVRIELSSGNFLEAFAGNLVRRPDDPNTIDGKEVRFVVRINGRVRPGKTDVIGKVVDQDHFSLRCKRWPQARGEPVPFTFVLTRSGTTMNNHSVRRCSQNDPFGEPGTGPHLLPLPPGGRGR